MTTYSVALPSKPSDGYGIRLTKIIVIENISNDFDVVKRLADTCNRCKVEAEFFEDVLENYLSDFENF